MFQFTPIVRILLILNIAAFVLTLILAESGFDVNAQFGLYSMMAPEFKPYQFLTYMFLHGSFFHLFGNMFGLLVFGALLERVLESNRFIALYFICGFGAAALNSGINYYEYKQLESAAIDFKVAPSPEAYFLFVVNHAGPYRASGVPVEIDGQIKRVSLDLVAENYERAPDDAELKRIAIQTVNQIQEGIRSIPMVGASGAVFGIIMAFALIFPNLQMMLLFPPIPIKAKYLVLFYAIFEIYAIAQDRPGDNVAHFAHVGGMLFAFLLIRYWRIPRHY
jgi:membrane associated rhomboid family serine protease